MSVNVKFNKLLIFTAASILLCNLFFTHKNYVLGIAVTISFVCDLLPNYDQFEPFPRYIFFIQQTLVRGSNIHYMTWVLYNLQCTLPGNCLTHRALLILFFHVKRIYILTFCRSRVCFMKLLDLIFKGRWHLLLNPKNVV